MTRAIPLCLGAFVQVAAEKLLALLIPGADRTVAPVVPS